MALMPPPVTLLILGWVALAKGWGVRRVHNKIHMLSNSTVFGKSHRPYLVRTICPRRRWGRGRNRAPCAKYRSLPVCLLHIRPLFLLVDKVWAFATTCPSFEEILKGRAWFVLPGWLIVDCGVAMSSFQERLLATGTVLWLEIYPVSPPPDHHWRFSGNMK